MHYVSPSVSLSRHRLLVKRFPTNIQQRTEGVRKAHEEELTRPSTRLSASRLQLSRRHSHRPPAASPGTRPVPKCRWSMDQVARCHREHTICALCDTWRRCWPGKAQDMNLSEICTLIPYMWQLFSPAKVVFAGVGVLLIVRIFLNISARPV